MTTLTVNRTCTRCPRTEQTEISVQEVVKLSQQGKTTLPEGPKAISIQVDAKTTIEYVFLCTQCKQIVARYLEHIAKKPKHQSSLRQGANIEIEDD